MGALMFIGGWLWAASGIAEDIDAGKPAHILGKDYECVVSLHDKALPRPPSITPED